MSEITDPIAMRIARDHIDHRGAPPLKEHDDFDIRQAPEQLECQVLRAADTGAREVELTGWLCERDQLLDRLHRQRGIDSHDDRTGGELAHGRKRFDRIEGQLRAQCRAECKRRGNAQDRMAVGLRLRADLYPDQAPGAGTIVDDHGLSQSLGEVYPHQAGDMPLLLPGEME
jgi:hypothetical protein